MKLSKEQILEVKACLEEMEVPEWGGSVYIRPITLAEQARLADLGTKFEKASVMERMKKCTMQLILWVVSDENGQALFAAEDMEKLLGKSASAFMRLQDAILALSGLTEESRKELEKNLLSGETASPVST